MSKTLTLTRWELVRQFRKCTWTEEDYQNYLQFLKQRATQHPDTEWGRNAQQEYDVLAAYTWDEIVNMFQSYNYDDIPMVSYTWNGHTSKERITDIIRDAIREDTYASDVIDEDYADDYDEDWEIDTGENQ